MNKYGGEDAIYMNGGVFKNKLFIQDSELLETAEKEFSAVRAQYLLLQPITGNFDLAHIQRPFIANCLAMFMIGQAKSGGLIFPKVIPVLPILLLSKTKAVNFWRSCETKTICRDWIKISLQSVQPIIWAS